MSWPFSPLVSFLPGLTPKITAQFLNDIQTQGIAPSAAVAYFTVPTIDVVASAGTTLSYGPFAVMVADSVTGEYGYVQMNAGTLTAADYTATPGTFPTSAWIFAYAYSANGTGYVELSTTDPTSDRLFKYGDTTRRYLFSARTGGGAALFNTARYRNYTRYLDVVDIFGSSGSFASWNVTPDVVDCSGIWPTSARAVDVRIDAVGSTADAGAGVYALTLAAAGFNQYAATLAPDNEIGETFQFWVAGYTTLSASVDVALTNGKGYLRMLGWQE